MSETSQYLKHYIKDKILLQYILLGVLVLSGVAIAFLGYLQYQSNPEPKYFAITKDKQIIKQSDLSKPQLANNELLNWFNTAMMASYNFNYHNVVEVVRNAKIFYNKNGYSSYLQALQANNIATVKKQQLVVTAIPEDVPKVLKEQVVNGRYAWKVEFPITLVYRNINVNVTRDYVFTAFVIRVPTSESPNGIKIAKLVSSRSAALGG